MDSPVSTAEYDGTEVKNREAICASLFMLLAAFLRRWGYHRHRIAKE
jgi:hypothetical protein